jgi:tungsten-dependent benzoyl-CoA reductase-related protein bamE
VLGGGLSGMIAALEIAKQGFEVHLVEKESDLGGNLRKLHYLLSGEDPKKKLKELIKEVEENQRIHAYTNTIVTNVEGYIGNFKTTLMNKNENKVEIEHGAVVVATGGEEYKPKEYLYGEDTRVITQLELEEKMSESNFETQKVVMIQCVGSRNDERTYCSRVCCAQAIKNALKIKEKNPDSNVYILYKDVRAYGFNEAYYKKRVRMV